MLTQHHLRHLRSLLTIDCTLQHPASIEMLELGVEDPTSVQRHVVHVPIICGARGSPMVNQSAPYSTRAEGIDQLFQNRHALRHLDM